MKEFENVKKKSEKGEIVKENRRGRQSKGT